MHRTYKALASGILLEYLASELVEDFDLDHNDLCHSVNRRSIPHVVDPL